MFDTHKELVKTDSKVSVARHVYLGSFYFSLMWLSWLVFKEAKLFVDVFPFFIGTFTAGYIGGKAMSAFSNKDVKG